MYITKSFCNIFAFVSNEPGVVSPIGELSTYAKTYEQDINILHNPVIDGYDLINFISAENDVPVTINQTVANQAIGLVDRAVLTTLGNIGEVYHDELIYILLSYAEIHNIFAVQIGPMVNFGDWWVPEWISFSSDLIEGDNTHKVWLSLDAFKVQYTDYTIVVVPPFDDLDSFFNPGSVVEARIKAITLTQMMERADVAKSGFPATVVRADPYEYRDPINQSRRFDTHWTVVIYGQAGNDPDLLRDEIANHILENSQYTREQWAVIFPDIFKRTEFIFAPFWDKYAAEQRVFDHGVYSPIVDPRTALAWMKQHAPEYAPEHIDDNMMIMSWPYRSVQIATIGHVENRDELYRIGDHYPDFISVGTESTDFNRMSVETQTWAMMMMELIVIAENMDTSTDLPRGIFRINRNGKIYVGKSHERVLYLVLPKKDNSI